MKCIQLNNGKIVRVPDVEARKLVDEKQGIYIPKKIWKRHKED